MRMYIIKKTEKIRYKIASLVLKHLTPVLYKKIDMSTFVNNKIFQLKADNIPIALRPSFKFMKKRFDGRLVKGAEIGVERGRNSEIILKELNIEKLYLIDVWDNYKESDITWSLENYRHVLRRFKRDKRVNIIKDYSEHAVNFVEKNSLDFVYIDANHSYEYVCKDLEIWFTRVKKGGVIAGHDVFLNRGTFYEVLEAVKDFCCENKIIFYIEAPDWYFINYHSERRNLKV